MWGGGSPVSGSHLRLDFDELLNEGSVPDGRSFHITVNGERRHPLLGRPRPHPGRDLAALAQCRGQGRRPGRGELQLGHIPLWWDHYGPLRDLAGNVVEEFSAGVASNAEGPPVFSEAEADGTRLTVTLNEEIDPLLHGALARQGVTRGSVCP